jgi:hypothetical protein
MTSETVPASPPPTTEKAKQQPQQPAPVRWAPLRIPVERRLQMMAVCVWISLVFICVCSFIFFATYKFLWPPLVAYISFLYVDRAPESGGRRFESARHWTIWKYFAAYFPVKLIKVPFLFFKLFQPETKIFLVGSRTRSY